VLEALHENSLPFLNDGQPVPVPTVGIAASLTVIVGVLAITTAASLLKSRRDVRRDTAAAERHAAAAAEHAEAPALTPGCGTPQVRRVPAPGRPDPSRA